MNLDNLLCTVLTLFYVCVTEALLWLFRSHNDHKRVLSALSEANCCGENTWTRQQYYTWVIEYLSILWRTPASVFNASGSNSSGDNVSPSMFISLIFPVLKTVFEYDANMGLGVLIGRSGSTSTGVGISADLGKAADPSNDGSTVGGKAVPVQEVGNLILCIVYIVYIWYYDDISLLLYCCC